MDINIDHGNHSNLYLSIGSSIISIAHFIIASEHHSSIAWAIGCVAGIVSICAGISTIIVNIKKARAK